MFSKGTKIYSIFNGKCPRCHTGKFFKYRFTYNFNKVTKLDDNCSNCNLKYMVEPSFYYGAMYISYGITVVVSIITFLIAKLIFDVSLLQSFATIIVVLLLMMPVNLRISRILWINMFVPFDEKIDRDEEVKN